MNAREEILRRVGSSLGASRTQPAAIAAELAAIPRGYQTESSLTSEDRIDLLCDRLRDYEANVHRCTNAEIATTVARVMGERQKQSLIAASGFPPEWLPGASVRDAALPYGELDQSEGAITDCALAIAVTGTLVLRHSLEGGRRALSLVPDYLLVIVRAEQIVETVPEAIRALSAYSTDALTTISGPSATADIEMIRIKGVHGPRILEVVLVMPEPSHDR
jgi:L-lactate dehydrogenase complex protein LldG